jgi:hypothetical protein
MRKTDAKHEPAKDGFVAPAAYISADERRAAGKALRDAAPRAAHGGWKPPEDRRDPVELLCEANEGRIPELIPLRFSRMAQSPFAFYRGAAAIMAADLASTPASRAGLRRRSPGEFRRFRHARAQHLLRHQRFRRNLARALGVGR